MDDIIITKSLIENRISELRKLIGGLERKEQIGECTGGEEYMLSQYKKKYEFLNQLKDSLF